MYIHTKGAKMTVSLKQWGNSLALRIPKDILTSLVVQKDSVMELSVNNGVLMVTPKKDDLLETLVSQISDENLHKEIESGKSVGNEEW